MKATQHSVLFGLAGAVLTGALSSAVLAQSVTLPPSGDNQKATVIQHIGPVEVRIDYSSPRVHLQGQDRTGKIWGELVPYGLHDLQFNDCKQCPWRAGANENTKFSVSHDVQIEGKALPKGTYGLHMLAGKDEFTVIFSKNAASWGSYWYNPAEDALRVTVKPEKAEFREWLTYDFIDREPAKARVALVWENLRVPFTVAVPDIEAVYLAQLRDELRGNAGFDWQQLNNAAQWALGTGKNLEEATGWAQRAVSAPFVGNENFQTLSTLASLQRATGKTADADKTLEKAIAHPTANPIQIHGMGRQLLQAGKKAEALKIFQANAKRFPNQWPVNVGLARGYAANGDLKKALEHAKLALAQAPDELNKKSLEGLIKQYESGKAN